MGRFLGVILFAGLALGSQTASATDFSTGLYAGFNGGGPSFRAMGGASNFAEGFPLSIELAIGYATRDPGDAFGARRVFIANATNGVPEKHGTLWDLRGDFFYHLRLDGLPGFYIFTGVRYSMFDAHFRYVGANEEFDVTSNMWGIGAGAKADFPISRKVSLALSGGLDFYFNGQLEGHDTMYSPDNQNVNPREDFTYTDARRVVNAPRVLPALLIGLNYTF